MQIKNSFFLKIFALVFAFSLAQSSAHARELIDQVGRSVNVPEEPRRIVSLMPSVTEMVYDLGAGDLLVGATLYATFPPEALSLPRVGSYNHLDVEKIVRLQPDLCLAVRDGNPIHIVDKLVALGVPVFVLDPRTLEEIKESVFLLGRALGMEKNAAIIAVDMDRRLAAIDNTVKLARFSPKVFFQIDAAPIISAGSNTFIDRLIVRAGGINMASGPKPYPRFSWEDILKMQPELVIIASMAGGHTTEELKAGWEKWPQIPAVKNNRLYVVDADLFDRPIPRLIDGLERLLEILHPELKSTAISKHQTQ
ncbi:MAG: cobalamin-binding protein [Desulfobulbaceae bacterium]|uniref:Cobalamin-binding protein n=1 Tax=Candidatus Desulfobia pelagia TaxID=2841692 RepID=A0A8J6TAK2_9BACT|nr:cobalamin-binding protein [Candidatus Desulfobia pelagia]